MTSIEIPHLAKGQQISEYKKIFAAAGAALKPEQLLACLPVYIHRTEGEKKLAFTAATKETLQEAFKFLEELIDGPPCRYTETTKFFNLLPDDTSIDGIRSYFFELCELATRAKISSDVCIMRFLTNVPGGKKLFEAKEEDIKSELDEDGMATFFKKVMPKLLKTLKDDTASLSVHDSFVFPVEHSEGVPSWAKDLQDEVHNLRVRVESKDSGCGESEVSGDHDEVFAFNKQSSGSNSRSRKRGTPNSGSTDRPKCSICGKLGHVKASCFQRLCECCNGKGHDAEVCPSKKNFQSKKFTRNDQRPR